MMNSVVVEGYAMYPQAFSKGTSFKVSILKSNSRKGDKDRSFFMKVKAFGNDKTINGGEKVIVKGRLDGHVYNGKLYIEILADMKDVRIVDEGKEALPSYPPGYPIPRTGRGQGDNIPF